LQEVVRVREARAQFAEHLTAVVHIQTAFRMLIARRRYRQMQKSARCMYWQVCMREI